CARISRSLSPRSRFARRRARPCRAREPPRRSSRRSSASGSSSAYADGGLARFLEAVQVQSKFVDDRYSVLGNGPIAIYRNLYELGRFLGRGLYFLIPLVAVAVISAEARRIELRDRVRTAFIALWVLTPLAFYVFI